MEELHKTEFISKPVAALHCEYLWVKSCIFYASKHIISHFRKSHSSLLKEIYQVQAKYHAKLPLAL